MAMDERWKEISDLAGAAADTAPEQRDALLASRPDLRDEVESLLRYLEAGSGPLDDAPLRPASASLVGREIGPYQIVRELAQGGMGVVLLARRADSGFEQLVAVKLARASFQSDFFARRFLEERQILARLEHPNIARLLDGGVTDDGTPYLVMQYVEGEPLDRWCATHELSLRKRVELFLKVCAAVEYAHEHLVVHRDLKPNNILVNASGEPMLLDFGTARLVETGETSGATRTALPMMTLRYASPEQIAGLAGTTRSDVYSLCVVLYELLTGRWPYPNVDDAAPLLMRAISESEPSAPSRSGALEASSLAGDIDAILLKGLDKKPERRYGTVAQLADDLRRLLSGDPVIARTPTLRYRAGKFLSRHRISVGAAAIVAIALSAATAISIRQARIADRERVKAEEVARFVERLLGASRASGVTPLAVRGRDLKVVEIIDDAGKTVGEEFKNNPDIEAGLRSTIGSTYMALGDYEKAKPHVDRAVELGIRLQDHPATARALTARGRLRLAAGDHAGARDDLRRSLATMMRIGSPNLSFLHSLLGEATLRLGDVAAARRHFEDSLDGMRRQFGTNHVATATLINNVGVVAEEAGDQDAAERHFKEAAAILRAMPGPPPNLLFPLIGLQRSHFYRREYGQAKAVCEEALAVARRQGEKSRHVVTAMSALALVKTHLGEADGEGFARNAVEMVRSVYPEDHFEISRALTILGRVLLLRSQAPEAERHLREALSIARKSYPGANWRPAESQFFLGLAIGAQGRTEESRVMMQSGLREMESVLPQSHPRLLEARGLTR